MDQDVHSLIIPPGPRFFVFIVWICYQIGTIFDMYININERVYICVRVCVFFMFVCVDARMCVCVCMRTCAYLRAYVRTCVCVGGGLETKYML